MKLLIALIDWEYPEQRGPIRPALWNLRDAGDLQKLVLALANGLVVELRGVAETAEGLEALRGLVTGTGSFRPIALEPTEQANLWLWTPGDEVYRQGGKSPAFAFLDPTPRPALFRTA